MYNSKHPTYLWLTGDMSSSFSVGTHNCISSFLSHYQLSRHHPTGISCFHQRGLCWLVFLIAAYGIILGNFIFMGIHSIFHNLHVIRWIFFIHSNTFLLSSRIQDGVSAIFSSWLLHFMKYHTAKENIRHIVILYSYCSRRENLSSSYPFHGMWKYSQYYTSKLGYITYPLLSVLYERCSFYGLAPLEVDWRLGTITFHYSIKMWFYLMVRCIFC